MRNLRPGSFGLVLTAILIAAVVSPLTAADLPTVAVSDLAVNSANPSYAFLGKGFAEIVAFELKKAPGLKLVDRGKRNEILKEMEFALSGIADEGSQMEIGKLLSVRFIIGGSITDMGDSLLVSLSMVNVETGEVAWNDQLQEASGKYAYIGAYFAKSLMQYFKLDTAKSTEVELAETKVKDTASVVALSQGIAALDEGDKQAAKEKLSQAAKIDPGNAVATAFLSLLASASAKFKVVPERYVNYYNPAYLGGMEGDRLFFSYNQGWTTYGVNDTNNNQIVSTDASTEWGSGEARSGQTFGYLFPFGRSFGVSLEGSFSKLGDSVVQKTAFDIYAQIGNQYPNFNKIIAGAGLAVNPQLSLGIGIEAQLLQRQYYEYAWPLDEYRNQENWSFGGIIAAVVKSRSGNLVWDVVGSYSTERLYYYDNDPAVNTFIEYGSPLYVEQTLTLALNDQTTFLALKQANDIYLDRYLYYGRIMPCFEQWFFDLFSVRVGAEGALVAKDGGVSFGWGGTAGLTFKVWKIEVDANYTFRQRPSRSLADVMIPESIVFATVSLNDLVTALMRK